MKIAMLASNFIKLPPVPSDIPKGYSGAPEYIAWTLTENLVKRGHQVTLFASGDSKTSASLMSVASCPSCKTEEKNNIKFIMNEELMLTSLLYKMANQGEFDVIHSHIGSRSAFFSSLCKIPTIVTLHSPLVGQDKLIYSNYPKDQYYVSISDKQRAPLPNLKYISTIYHGLSLSEFPYSDKKEDYLLFVGRITPQKGVFEAIKTAKILKKKLVILGTPPKGSLYFEKKIKPLVDGVNIEVHGFVEKKSLYDFMKRACCLIFPIQWEEPFGLVMIEAMATGTPVVAFNRGSVSEVIKDGETGFVVSSRKGVQGLVSAISKINKIKSSDCRSYVEKRFSIEKMVEEYEKAYQKVLKNF